MDPKHSDSRENDHRFQLDPDPEAPRPGSLPKSVTRPDLYQCGEHPAVTDDDLARFLLDGDLALEDERLCLCGHLEADHRCLTESCSRCIRCTGFAVEPQWEITVESPVPTEEEMRAELAAARARREALEAEIVAAAEGRR